MMLVEQRRIFGKTFEISYSRELAFLIAETFALYPRANESTADVRLNIGTGEKRYFGCYRNPILHIKTVDEMVTRFPHVNIGWRVGKAPGESLRIDVELLRICPQSIVHRIRSMEYPTPAEWFEQLIHELVIVPAMYFFQDRALLHASCFVIEKKVIAFAGTGGVGKSSAIIGLKNLQSTRFITDDILIVGDEGNVYGNMAWPKIYGYNIENSSLKRQIFSGRSIFDRLHFEIGCKIDPASVRRKIKPNKLYDDIEVNEVGLTHVICLVRASVDQVVVEQITADRLAKMSSLVMQVEYNTFHNHIYWEQYNALAGNLEPQLDMISVQRRWHKLYMKCFGNACIQLMTVPLETRQKELVQFLTAHVQEISKE